MAKSKLKPAAAVAPMQETIGEKIEDEVHRLTPGFELTYTPDDYCGHFSIDLEHDNEAHWLMAVYDCDGNIAKQIVAECERVASVYQRLARTVKEQTWLEHLEAKGSVNIAERGA